MCSLHKGNFWGSSLNQFHKISIYGTLQQCVFSQIIWLSLDHPARCIFLQMQPLLRYGTLLIFFPYFVQGSLNILLTLPRIQESIFYFSIPRFLKIPWNFKLVINGKIILIHINTHTYIYGRCIYVCAGNIFTFICCNTVTISHQTCLLRCTLLIFRLQGCLSSALPSHRESS